MKILHVIGSVAPRYGGPSIAVMEMCAALAAKRHHVEIITTNIDGPSTLDVPLDAPVERDGVTTWYYPVQRPRSYATSLPLQSGLARRIGQFDVVEVHSLYLFHTLVACRSCRRNAVPYVLRPHGTLDAYHRSRHRMRKRIYGTLVENRNLDGAAAIHCTSQAEREEVERAAVSAPCVVIPLGVSKAEPPRLSFFNERFPQLAGRRLVTFLGRLARKKGIDVLMQALPAIRRSCPDAVLVIAGPEDQLRASEIRAIADAYGCADDVLLTGLLTGEAKASLLHRSTLVVLPSLDESFGVAVVEAMAAGVPVIVSPHVALHREVAEGGAGLVVARDSSTVARAVVELLEDPARARRMGARGRELANTTYTWDAVAEKLERLYSRILGGSPAQTYADGDAVGTHPD